MDSLEILKCIADPQRLRILNLLEAGPLCVCHIQDILEAPQVKISKQLATIKQLGLIHAEREGTWMIYRLSEPVDTLLKTNLSFLREHGKSPADKLNADLKARKQLVKELSKQPTECPTPVCEMIGCC